MTAHRMGGPRVSATFVDNTGILKGFLRQFETTFETRVHSILIRLNARVTLTTAVHSGETLINWKWSAGTPDISHRNAIRTPSSPGLTSNMQLGTEPRRAANNSPVTESLTRVLAISPLPASIWLTNTGEVAEAMEYGRVADDGRRPTLRTRGMLRLAIKEATLFAPK